MANRNHNKNNLSLFLYMCMRQLSTCMHFKWWLYTPTPQYFDRSEKQSRDSVDVVYTDLSNRVFLPALSATRFSKHMVSLPLAPLNKATFNFSHRCYE